MRNKKIILSDICIYKIGLKRKLSQQIEKIQQQVNDLCIELEDNLRDCELADIDENTKDGDLLLTYQCSLYKKVANHSPSKDLKFDGFLYKWTEIEEVLSIDHKSQMLSTTNLKGTSSSVGQIHHDTEI